MSANPQIVQIFLNYHLRKLKEVNISNLYLSGHTFEFHSQTERLRHYVTMLLSWQKGINSD